MVSIPLPTFDAPFSSPLEEKLTSDGKSATGKMTIYPGVKVDGVAGDTTTIGGISSTVKVNKAVFPEFGYGKKPTIVHCFRSPEIIKHKIMDTP
jgi:hypothetical protein